MRRAVRRVFRNDEEIPFTEEGLLYLITSTDDFMNFWWKDSEYEKLLEKASMIDHELLNNKELEDIHLSRIKSTMVLSDWIEEFEHRELEKRHNVMPGDLRTRIELAEWLLFSAKQILFYDKKFDNTYSNSKTIVMERIENLRKRIRYGCKKELLNLVTLPNIGRKRARDLVNLGLQRPNEILKLTSNDKNKLLSLPGWGPKLLEKLVQRIKKDTEVIEHKEMRADDEPLPEEK